MTSLRHSFGIANDDYGPESDMWNKNLQKSKDRFNGQGTCFLIWKIDRTKRDHDREEMYDSQRKQHSCNEIMPHIVSKRQGKTTLILLNFLDAFVYLPFA